MFNLFQIQCQAKKHGIAGSERENSKEDRSIGALPLGMLLNASLTSIEHKDSDTRAVAGDIVKECFVQLPVGLHHYL
jgi:hypothetical protein